MSAKTYFCTTCKRWRANIHCARCKRQEYYRDYYLAHREHIISMATEWNKRNRVRHRKYQQKYARRKLEAGE